MLLGSDSLLGLVKPSGSACRTVSLNLDRGPGASGCMKTETPWSRDGYGFFRRLAFFARSYTVPRMNLAQRTAAAAREVEATIRRLPPEVREFAKTIPVHYEARPPKHVIDDGFPDDILGLFDGSAHGEELSQDQPMPPQISLYLDNIWDFVEQDREAFLAEVGVTYLHELGHYFGWDEDDLAERDLD